jgi:hypothetical protein
MDFFRGKGELVAVIDIENWCVVLIPLEKSLHQSPLTQCDEQD